MCQFNRICVLLIKPAQYGRDGYKQEYGWGVLPSNSLAVMNSLTKEALAPYQLKGIPTELYVLEDGIRSHVVRLNQLFQRFKKGEPGTRLIVGLVAVQTAQFPRALDLINRWQSVGAGCVIGGFHVSGMYETLYTGISDKDRPDVPCDHKVPADIEKLLAQGVSVFVGEAEGVWSEYFMDIANGQSGLFRNIQPNISKAALPAYPEDYFRNCFATDIRTFDAGRGCKFACKFCSIINVQGRVQRSRDIEPVLVEIERLASKNAGEVSFFLTDDNFCRNPTWEPFLRGLVALREKGIDVSFMIQADLLCGSVRAADGTPFLELFAAAGGSQIFMGVESVNVFNLKKVGKLQNAVKRYQDLWSRCHEIGIVVHAAYILGFPDDTPGAIASEIEILKEMGADQASIFMMTLLPGSENYVRHLMSGEWIEPNYSCYDSFNPTFHHPKMSDGEWREATRRAYRQFYCPTHMVEVLRRFSDREKRLNLFRNFVWYWWSIHAECIHPMIAGFWRVRRYSEYQSDLPRTQGPLGFLTSEVWRYLRYIGYFLACFFVFQYVYFETEYRESFIQQRGLASTHLRSLSDYFRRIFGRAMSRVWLNRFWIEYGHQKWHLLNPLKIYWHVRMAPRAFAEIIYTARFMRSLIKLFKKTTGRK